MNVIIIGGGLLGLLSARELALAGSDVTVLDQSAPGQESSWAGGGILSPLYPWQYAEPVNALAHWGQQHYPELVAALMEEGGMDPQWTQSGLLVLDSDMREAATAFARDYAMPLELVDARMLAELEPQMAPQSQPGLLFPSIAQIRNPRFVKCLLTSCATLGVRFSPRTQVTGFRYRDGQILGVNTAKGGFDAEAVLVAGGAWSGHLLKGIKVDLDVEPVRGQMVLYRAVPGELEHIVLDRGHYLIPRRDGRILVGSTLEYVGFDKSTTAPAREQLTDFAVNLFPFLANIPIEQHWSGLRPGQSGAIPYICTVPGYAGLYLNTGHFRNGVILGPASAHLVADLILGREPILDPAPYGLAR